MRAALGFGTSFLTRVSLSTAQHPATSGVAMLVPSSKKKAGSFDVPKNVSGSITAPDLVDRIPVPGAQTSGFRRFSLVGPRLLKAAIPSGLSALRSLNIGSLGKDLGRNAP